MCVLTRQHTKASHKSFTHPLKKQIGKRSQTIDKSERTAKELLGELYTDKEFLEKLIKDEGVFVYRLFAHVQKIFYLILPPKYVVLLRYPGLKTIYI